jgi:hypothetical protein
MLQFGGAGLLKAGLHGRFPQCGCGHFIWWLSGIRPVMLLPLPLQVTRFAKAMLLALQWRFRRTT